MYACVSHPKFQITSGFSRGAMLSFGVVFFPVSFQLLQMIIYLTKYHEMLLLRGVGWNGVNGWSNFIAFKSETCLQAAISR